MQGTTSSWRAAVDWAVIGLFLAAIAAPSIDEVLRPAEARGPLREKRPAARKPELALEPAVLNSFPERYDAWYRDSFGLRDKLLRWNSIEKLELLRVSPTPKVVLGKDDWLFYTGTRSIEVWRGVDPFTPAELERWRKALEGNRARLKELGISYEFVLGPNKETIYPEQVAARFDRVGPTRMEQLMAYMDSHSDFRILDLRPALLEAKKEDRPGNWLYFRDGTHWDARGILAVYRELIASLAQVHPGWTPLDASRLEMAEVPGTVDSWADIMYVYDRRPQEARLWRILPQPSTRTVLLRGGFAAGRVKITELDAPDLPFVLFIHDSFGSFLDELLAESSRRLDSRWKGGFEVADLGSKKPEVVIHLLVERVLVERPPEQIEMKTR